MTRQATANTENKFVQHFSYYKVTYSWSFASCCFIINAQIESEENGEDVDGPITQICQLKVSSFHLIR